MFFFFAFYLENAFFVIGVIETGIRSWGLESQGILEYKHDFRERSIFASRRLSCFTLFDIILQVY